MGYPSGFSPYGKMIGLMGAVPLFAGRLFAPKAAKFGTLMDDILSALRTEGLAGSVKPMAEEFVHVGLMSGPKEVGGLKFGLNPQGDEVIIKSIGRFNRAAEEGRGVPSQAIQTIIDQAAEQGLPVRAKNAPRLGVTGASWDLKKQGPPTGFIGRL